MTAIVARGLRKAFGAKVVLDGIDLDVADGRRSRVLQLSRRWEPPRDRY